MARYFRGTKFLMISLLEFFMNKFLRMGALRQFKLLKFHHMTNCAPMIAQWRKTQLGQVDSMVDYTSLLAASIEEDDIFSERLRLLQRKSCCLCHFYITRLEILKEILKF